MRYLPILAAFAALFVVPAHAGQTVELQAVCFTPGEDCTSVITDAIASARRQVLVQAYSFTSAPIAKALVDARKRGLDVRVILDKSQRSEKYSGADFLANQGVPVLIDAQHAIAHNKVIVIDGSVVITGSFNFTKAAQEKNAENLIVLRDELLAARYARNWQAHASHSEPYRGRGRGATTDDFTFKTGEAAGAKKCRSGIPCGDTCISADKACRK